MGLRTPPDILYKYSSFDGAEAILKSGKIKITPPHEFNDPFECLPAGFDNISQNKLEEIEGRRKNELIESCLGKGLNREAAEKFYKDDFIPQFVEKCRCDWGYLKDAFCKEYEILCLSEVFDDILMWSHYTDRHQGIVIGFNPQQLSPPFYHVDYSNDRVKELFYNDEVNQENVRKLILVKYEHWKYEKEWRAMYELKSLEKEGERYLLKFPVGAVKEVIIGAEASPKMRKKIARLVKDNYPEAKIKQAELSKNMFALEIN